MSADFSALTIDDIEKIRVQIERDRLPVSRILIAWPEATPFIDAFGAIPQDFSVAIPESLAPTIRLALMWFSRRWKPENKTADEFYRSVFDEPVGTNGA